MFRKIHVLLIVAIVACVTPIFVLRRDYAEPHYELVPERQMARSPAFGAFKPNPNFANGITFQNPPKGTIARGEEVFPYGSEPTEMKRAGKDLKNPLSFNTQTREQGAALYANFCQCCHGPTGMRDGPVTQHGYPRPQFALPDNDATELKDGELFHIITQGHGRMPSHAVQLTPTERWTVILHVRVLQNKYTDFPKVSLEETKQTFLANCAACHGQDGAGSLMRGKLPNLPDFSSLAWQLAKSNLEITNRIEYGDEPMMPAFRYRLKRDQVLGLSIYIRSFAVKEGGPPTKPAPLPSTAGLEREQIFRAYCLACHNADGKGAIVRPGMPDIPDFTSTKWPGSKTDAELSKSILSGGKFMPPMKDKLAPETADKMVQFVRKFKDGAYKIPLESKGEVPIAKTPQINPSDLPPIPKKSITPMPTSPEVASRLRRAGVIFREYCIVCHGVDGTGAAAIRATMPALPNFTKTAFRDQHSDPQLLISILDGKGTLMPANRGRINEAQARDLVAYVRAFGPAGAEAAVGPPNEFQRDFEQLQRQWEALEREIRALKKSPPP